MDGRRLEQPRDALHGADYSVFSILPPYNTIHAQVLDGSGRLVTNPAAVSVTYQAVADPSGSINTTSSGKTNFWTFVSALFGAPLAVDVGLAGKSMPGSANTPQVMVFEPAQAWFAAYGIPITPYQDGDRRKNPYPMMQVTARDPSGAVLATTQLVLPVSDEMSCTACHASASGPAARPATGWVNDPDPQRDYRLNILKLHDDRQLANPTYAAALVASGYGATGLYPTVLGGKPVLCAACHASEALGTGGAAGTPSLTSSVHTLHATVTDPATGQALGSSANRSACYRCHPGAATRCLRGVMGNSIAADGSMAIQCQSCHGGLAAVGATTRTGWLMEPSCQQCHTGTATSNNGAIRYVSAFDGAGQPRTAVNATFATNPGTPAAGLSLYRFSKGHGGLQCSACHGSTHAEYPSSHVNDNVFSQLLQGHAGTIAECSACHPSAPITGSGGPHGLHTLGDSWARDHADLVERNGVGPCKSCHGADLRGTVLSRALGPRTVTTKYGARALWRGYQVSCSLCHDGVDSSNASPNHLPTVRPLTASTTAGVSVPVALSASDPDGDGLTLRIVNQPTNGTAALAGTTATYFPYAGFTGTDAFTYAAWDGSADSNLATVTVTVSGVYGDLNVDGTRDVFDVVILSAYIVGNATPGTPPFNGLATGADVNRDGSVDVFDVVLLMGFIVGNVPSLPV